MNTSADNSKPGGSGKNGDDKPAFECNICFDAARDAVVSQCGHLFCWPCLHQWIETKSNNPQCPVCKSAISRDKVTPIYGKGSSSADPRDKVPPRPSGTREEAPEDNGYGPFGGFGGGPQFQMSFGIGAFPFGLFAATWNNGRQQQPPRAGRVPARDADFLSNALIGLAVVFFIWMLLV